MDRWRNKSHLKAKSESLLLYPCVLDAADSLPYPLWPLAVCWTGQARSQLHLPVRVQKKQMLIHKLKAGMWPCQKQT